MNKFFRIFLPVLLLLNAFVCGALEVRFEAVRRNVIAGRFIELQLVSDKKITGIETPEVKNARWENSYTSSSMQNINGKVSYTRLLMLAPLKEGEIVIPPFKVRAGNESAMTGEIRVRVLPRSNSDNSREAKIEDVLQGKITIAGNKRSFYTGEELTIFCDLLIDAEFINQIRPNYFPELLNTDNAVFTTWNYRNTQVRFQPSSPREILIKERPFMRHRFTARCRVLIPGTFAPGATIRVGILQQNREEDDFFGFGGSFFSSNRFVPYTLRFTPAPPVEIKALPPLPEGMISSGLVGKWQISAKVSSSSLHQGEAAEVVLSFTGEGAEGNFRAPELKFPGFRVYPPEVTVKPRTITARYALIPLEPGEKSLKFAPAYFDPAQQKWQSTPFEFKTAVIKGNSAPALRQNFAPAAPRDKGEGKEKDASPQEQYLLYQKNMPGPLVELPLIRNSLFRFFLFLLGMPLAALFIELYFRRREKESASPELRAQKMRKKALRELADELKRKGDTPEFRKKLLPLLGESMGLSAGASAGEIAAHLEDPELCRYFTELESSSYMPGASQQSDLLTSSGKKALLGVLKKFSLWFMVLFFSAAAAGTGLNELFNRGDFAGASAHYLKLSGGGSGYRPGMLYNYGNCQYLMNNLPEAKWALNLAHLLAPHDREIRTNLELVNARLFAENERVSTFTAFLTGMRDRIRCDNYLLLAAFGWGVLWIVWSFRRKLGSSVYYSCSGAVLLLVVLSLLSAAAQMRSVYSADKIIITAKNAELRTLPGKNSGVVESTIPGGNEGELLQRDSSGFCRVRINGREGWIDGKTFKHTFPGKLF